MIRKPSKSVLRNHLFGTAESITPKDHDVCVINGGTLLHKVHWPKSAYGEVFYHYIKYVKSKYEKCKSVNVVFDGYSDTNSAKVQEHHRRTIATSASLEIMDNNIKVTFTGYFVLD